ncbi:sodium-dependent transporter [Nafulsella turpanensis]|uniref:sodium-dependent transporter n=1 Tax=Nafulsella turpanensis TaxID=1265690 RepID=UPI00036CA426|nr:sodium-dependent transporter [Nafulsella turpanensis]
MSANNESWGTRVGLILAMAGNAVGLGNFLRFPVQAVQNGGGAFIIPYLICFLVMGIPLLWIEWSMGRYGGRFGNHSTPFILDQMTRRRFWKYFGAFGIFTNIAVAAYYCYIESWTLAYVFHSLMQTFAGLTQGEVAAFFDRYTTITSATTGVPYESVVFYILCLVLNTYILSRGLSGGVEKVAKVGVPLLIVFGAFLAVRGFTLGDAGAPEGCTDCNSYLGLNFLWEPQFDSLLDPTVWLAAAGQIFFTLSVGMGTVQCYASYIRKNDDIALNSMSAGWMNGFVEIVLGASIVIPIAVGYLGLDWVKENAGFAMAFQTMPFLFDQWGTALATLGGVAWFGLLFFAGITSSLAMGTPWMGFMEDEFGWKREKAAWSFGGLVLLMGLPTVYFYNEGVLWEYDYWAGTVSLVVFALAESIIFAYIFGINNGWEEINRGADIKVPAIFKPLIKFVTPILLLVVFLSSLVTPVNGDWGRAFSGDWELDDNSIIGKITNQGFDANREYFADHFEATVPGEIVAIEEGPEGETVVAVAQLLPYHRTATNEAEPVMEASQLGNLETFDSLTVVQTYKFEPENEIIVSVGDEVEVRETIALGDFTNPIFYIDLAKILLTLLFVFICAIIYVATVRREKQPERR